MAKAQPKSPEPQESTATERPAGSMMVHPNENVRGVPVQTEPVITELSDTAYSIDR